MISDLTIADSSATLQEYYNRLYTLQAEAHTTEYMMVHDEIRSKLRECDSYTELGVNQGATLAVAVLKNIKKVRAYDIALRPYERAKHLFDEYVGSNGVDLVVEENDTVEINIDEVDVLYIDTLHRYDHLSKELKLHGHKVRKYIIFHDTFAQKELKQAVREYVAANKEWNIITDCQESVGFMTIKRVST